jgi:hypothetical protein
VETRETFAGLALWEKGLWYGLVLVSTAIFFWGEAWSLELRAALTFLSILLVPVAGLGLV